VVLVWSPRITPAPAGCRAAPAARQRRAPQSGGSKHPRLPARTAIKPAGAAARRSWGPVEHSPQRPMAHLLQQPHPRRLPPSRTRPRPSPAVSRPLPPLVGGGRVWRWWGPWGVQSVMEAGRRRADLPARAGCSRGGGRPAAARAPAEAADTQKTAQLARIDDLAASFAEVERRAMPPPSSGKW